MQKKTTKTKLADIITQGQAIQIGGYLGFANFDRRAIHYWESIGVFPQPLHRIKGSFVFYALGEVQKSYSEIGKRMRVARMVQHEDIIWATEQMRNNHSYQNTQKFFDYIKKETI